MMRIKDNMLLIADPFLKDDHFKRSVIYLCSHNKSGSIGFALNRKFNLSLNQLIDGLGQIQTPVYVGGPVENDSIHFLHQYPNLIPGSQKISESVYWGGDFESVKELILKNKPEYDKIKFFLGYSGWSSGQLNGELKEKSWLLSKSTDSIVFNCPSEYVWKESILLMGPDYNELINYPLDPHLN